MFGSFQICRVFGIPIRVHITLVLILPFLAKFFAPGDGGSDMFWGLIGATTLFASVALHELGHSVAALRLGYKVRDITLWPIGGVAMLAEMPSRPRDEIIIAIAGPLVSLALGAAGLAIGPLVFASGLTIPGNLISVLGGVNLVLFAFNLIPAFPMDGGRLLRAGLTFKFGRLEATRIAAKIGRTLAFAYGLYCVFHGLWLNVILSLFVFKAAGQEYRVVQMQERMRWSPVFNFWGQPLGHEVEPEVSVGPPPYRR